jgi:hypothetical protein
MGKFLSIALCFIILMQTFSKSGLVAVYSLNKDYIASTLCENKEKPAMSCEGKCYLKKQLEQDDKNQSDSNAPASKEKSEINIFCSEVLTSNTFIEENVHHFSVYKKTYSFHSLQGIFHPPLV